MIPKIRQPAPKHSRMHVRACDSYNMHEFARVCVCVLRGLMIASKYAQHMQACDTATAANNIIYDWRARAESHQKTGFFFTIRSIVFYFTHMRVRAPMTYGSRAGSRRRTCVRACVCWLHISFTMCTVHGHQFADDVFHNACTYLICINRVVRCRECILAPLFRRAHWFVF